MPPEQTDCNDCYGEDGGSLTVNASNIYVNKGIDTSGGWAFDYVWGNTGHPYYQSIRIGCNGRDGGDITLNASTFLNISPEGADLDLEGGEGGTGSPYNGGANGEDGNNGVLSWSGATITVAELALSPANPQADLDLYLINLSGTNIISQSIDTGGYESITSPWLSPGKYLVGVSFSDDDPDFITTDYTLNFNQ